MFKLVLVFMLSGALFGSQSSLSSIYDNIVMKNSKNALHVAYDMQNSIINNGDTKAEFTKLVKAWKSVEAFYILGDLDDNFLDTPRYIDTFHQGNEDIKKQLNLIIEDSEDLSVALYKNSHKTINALEYILFTQDMKSKRVKDIAIIIIKKMSENLKEIEDGYIQNREKFISDEKSANAMMLNSLIENSYKLKEWRVGDSAGLSRKFRGKADNRRAEYSISKNSIVAIKSMLKIHLHVLDKQKFENFGSMIESYEVKDELHSAVKYLKLSLKNCDDVKDGDFSTAKPLYKSLKKLHVAYYISLIGKLKITSKILDADGD